MRFWRMVIESATLRARAREIAEEMETVLAELINESGEDLPGSLAAGMIVGACRATYLESARRILAGETADDVLGGYVTAINTAFDALERGLSAG